MSSKFGQIRPWTAELAALEHLKNQCIMFSINTLATSFLIGSSSFLQVTRSTIKFRMSSKFTKIRPWTAELAALERLKKSPKTYNGRNVVTTLAPSFLIGTSFLQETRKCIKDWMSLNFNQI